MHHVFKLKNNHDFNIDQNNRRILGFFSFFNGAALGSDHKGKGLRLHNYGASYSREAHLVGNASFVWYLSSGGCLLHPWYLILSTSACLVTLGTCLLRNWFWKEVIWIQTVPRDFDGAEALPVAMGTANEIIKTGLHLNDIIKLTGSSEIHCFK